jgi:nucleotide-binding universal stress UspA family protein
MASHGRRALGRLLLGSQTSEVLARCGVPVLVIR